MTSTEVFSKNGDACRQGPGAGYRASVNRCIHYYLVSKICIVVDNVPLSLRPAAAAKLPGAEDKTDRENSTGGEAGDKKPTSNPDSAAK